LDNAFDLVITVCDNARETCPIFKNAKKVIHVGYEDPSSNGNTKKEDYIITYERIRKELLPRT